MSILGDLFPVDVFISYRWNDVRNIGNSGFILWADHFQRALSLELDAIYDSAARVILDKNDIDPLKQLDPQLEKYIKDAAVFVPLITHHYPKSEYCRKELEWWRQAQAERGLEEDDRLVIVRIWGAPPYNDPDWRILWSERNFKFQGVYFYARDEAPSHPHPFGWSEKNGDRIVSTKFHDAIMDLCDRLAATFDKFLQEYRRKASAQQAAARRTLKVYVHGLADAEKQWQSLAGSLAQHALQVVPGEPERIARTLQERVQNQDRIVQILGECDGVVVIAPDEDERLLNEALFALSMTNLALASSKQPRHAFPIAVVDPVSDPARAAGRESILKSLQIGRFMLDSPDLADSIQSYVREKQG